MLDFLVFLANLAYFGSPLFFGTLTGLVGAFSPRISVRKSLLSGLVVGLVGVVITTAILQSYGYWNENLRGWPHDYDNLDYFMVSIRPLIVWSPLFLAALTVGATLLIMRFKLRPTTRRVHLHQWEESPQSMSHLPHETIPVRRTPGFLSAPRRPGSRHTPRADGTMTCEGNL